MHKHILLIFSIVSFCLVASVYGQGRTDSVFYNKEGKGVPSRAFADYYRVAFYPSDGNYAKQFRDYYISGQLRMTGNFISIDKYDDSKSEFNGDIEMYHSNGNIAYRFTLVDGNYDGECYEYTEEGYVKRKYTYKNGVRNGQQIEFMDDGSGVICEYTNDKPASTYTHIMPDGHQLVLRRSDNKPVWKTPSRSEQGSFTRSGCNYAFYDNNGLVVANSVGVEKDLYTGKWWKIYVLISNNSNVPIEISDDNIKAICVKESNQEQSECDVYSRDRYIRRIQQAQNAAMAFAAIGNGVAAATAGYSTTQTNSSSTYGGSSYSSGSAYAYGTGGSAYGSYYDNTIYSGYSYTNSSSVTYDGYAAYQAQILANEQMSQLSDNFWWKKSIADAGYLKSNTLMPGESISGYVMAKCKGRAKGKFKGRSIFISVKIEGADYIFGWGPYR